MSQNMKRIRLAVILFYLTLFAGLALYDERPDPELTRLMAQPQPEVMEPGNLWLAMLGFSAPHGASPLEAGMGTMRKPRDAVQRGVNYEEPSPAPGGRNPELVFKGKLPSFYGQDDIGILRYASSHAAEVSAFLRDNAELLARYEALRAYPRFAEPLDYGYSTPIPRFTPLRDTQRIRLLHLADVANRGDLAGALAGVRDDAEFWRFIAGRSRTLIARMIAFSFLNTDLKFAAELGTNRVLNAREMEMARKVLRPFDGGELSLAGVFRAEVRYMQRGMELSMWKKTTPWNPQKLFCKQNATSNRMYSDYRENIRLAELPPRGFAQEVKRRGVEKAEVRKLGLPYLYNPVGEILAMVGMPGMTGYIERGHNLEGLRRLALLKVLARQENVPPERMGHFLESHAKELGNPYNGAPMIWNPAKGSISFSELSGQKSVEIVM